MAQVLDIVVEGKILLELKAVSQLTDVFKQKVLSYLKATGLKLGILINFGKKSRIQSYRKLKVNIREIRRIREIRVKSPVLYTDAVNRTHVNLTLSR